MSGARRVPVRGVTVVDLRPAVDGHGLLDPREARRIVHDSGPGGLVDLLVGDLHSVPGDVIHELAREFAGAHGIEIRGSDPAAVRTMVRWLQAAFEGGPA